LNRDTFTVVVKYRNLNMKTAAQETRKVVFAVF
jgi:hypothetical protein